MTPKDVSIRVGDVTLSTANVPKDGIDLTKLNESTRQALSIFDTNGDKKLSKTEIENGIIKLANADRTHSEEKGDQIITTKKNGVLENIELETLKLKIDPSKTELAKLDLLENQALENKALLKEIKSKLKEFAEKQGISIEEAKKQIADVEAEINKALSQVQNMRKNKRTASSYEIKNAAKELQKQMVAENEIKKNGLQRTYHDDWLKDAEGNHYRYNAQAMKFEKVDNVEYVGKDGSYRTRTKNSKGQQVVKTHNKPNGHTIKVLNHENKAYLKPDYAAKVAGLEKSNSGIDIDKYGKITSYIYNDVNNNGYVWDNEKHIFRQAWTDIVL